MLAILLSGLIASASVTVAQDQLFEATDGWRVFKQKDGCVGFFNAPGATVVSVFYPNSREGLTLIIQSSGLPTITSAHETVLVRAGRTQWGPVDAGRYQSDAGAPGVIFNVRRPKALAEFGKADSITLTKRFQPPKTIPLTAADKGADMLSRCVG